MICVLQTQNDSILIDILLTKQKGRIYTSLKYKSYIINNSNIKYGAY